MDRFRAKTSLSPLRQAEAYWSALYDGDAVPLRSQIDPRGLENILSYTFILERVAPGVARFRLAGQHLHALAGMEVRGMPISSFFAGSARAEMSAALETVFDKPAIAELSLAVARTRLGEHGEGRMILLPLRNETGQVNRILGVLVTDGEDEDGPGRFHITKTALRPLGGVPPRAFGTPATQDDAADGTMDAQSDDQTQGFAEGQAPLSGRAPHLRLIK